MGNASTNSGMAIFINTAGRLKFVNGEERYPNFSLKGISQEGGIYGDFLDYDEDDPRCCPSIKTPAYLILYNNGFERG
jgi:hypothetical protein